MMFPNWISICLNRPDLASAGAGETPIIAIAPAIANAVFHATGIRAYGRPCDYRAEKIHCERLNWRRGLKRAHQGLCRLRAIENHETYVAGSYRL